MAEEPQPADRQSITQILNVAPVLPGEDANAYRSGLQATIQELEATTPLQIYLTEKIFEGLWWLRRYENQKRWALLDKMAHILDGGGYSSTRGKRRQTLFQLLSESPQDQGLLDFMAKANHTHDSLQQEAMAALGPLFGKIDQQIANCTKTLAGFQMSFEVSANRKINRERLMLQNDLLRRDLKAIEHEQPQKAKSQQG